MLDDTLKLTKIFSVNSSGIIIKPNLEDLSKQTKIAESEIATVTSTMKKNHVIFTTASGKKFNTSSNFNLSTGDKIRIHFKENDKVEILSIYEKYTTANVNKNQTIIPPNQGVTSQELFQAITSYGLFVVKEYKENQRDKKSLRIPNDSLVLTKISRENSQGLTIRTNLRNPQEGMRTGTYEALHSEVATVGREKDKDHLIFITSSGKKFYVSAELNLSSGDKVRIDFKDDDKVEILLLDEKYARENQGEKSDEFFIVNDYRDLSAGDRFSAIYVALEFDSESKDNIEASVDINLQFNKNQKYVFEVIAISTDEDINDTQYLYNNIEFESNGIKLLREILSDDEDSQYNIAGKVFSVKNGGILLKTIYGNFLMIDHAYLEIGSNLVIRLIEDELPKEIFNPKIHDLKNLVNKLEYSNLLIDNIIQKYGTSLTHKMIFWLANLLSIARKNIDTSSSEALLEEICKIIPESYNKELNNENVNHFLKNLHESSIQIQSYILFSVQNLQEKFWYEIQVPFNYIGEQNKQSLFFQKISSSVIRIISDINLTEIGDIQLDSFLHLKNLNISNSYRDSGPSIIAKIEMTITHNNKLPQDFFNYLKQNFEQYTKHFMIPSSLIFMHNEYLKKIEIEDIYKSSEEENSFTSLTI